MARTFLTESSATSLTSQFYMQNFYRMNRNAMKVSTRSDYTKTELSYEDSRALKKAIAKLGSFNYDEDENGDNLLNTIKAFTETYNFTLESSSSEDSEMFRQNKQLKALTKKYEKTLKDIGISIEDDGKLSISENILKGSSFEEVGNVFSSKADYITGVRSIAKRMHNNSYDAVYAQMTGAGGRLNILL